MSFTDDFFKELEKELEKQKKKKGASTANSTRSYDVYNPNEDSHAESITRASGERNRYDNDDFTEDFLEELYDYATTFKGDKKAEYDSATVGYHMPTKEDGIRRDASDMSLDEMESLFELNKQLGVVPNISEESKKKVEEARSAYVRNHMPSTGKLPEYKSILPSFDFFQSGPFKDGYDFGDVTKAILGTAGDTGLNVVKGFTSIVEGVGDTISYGVADVADWAGADEWADDMRAEAKKEFWGELLAPADNFLEKYSLFGETTDSIAQGVGQVGTLIGLGGFGAGAGLGTAGTTAITSGTMFTSSYGNGVSEALRSGATEEEARVYGLIAGASDTISEMLWGGLGKGVNAIGISKGMSSLDDVAAKKLSNAFKNEFTKNWSELFVKAGFEGAEEVIAAVGQAAGKTIYSEEDFWEILEDENLLEQFVVGAITSGLAQSGYIPGTSQGSLKESNQTGRDFITGLTANEQAVIDKEVEKRIEEAEKDGTKLSNKDKNKIVEQVKADLDKGRISTGTIEGVLGGEDYTAFSEAVKGFEDNETYKAYKDAIAEEKAWQDEFDALKDVNSTEATLGQADRFNDLKKRLEGTRRSSELRAQLEPEIQRINALQSKLRQSVIDKSGSERLRESYRELQRSTEKYQGDVSKYKSEAARKTIQNLIDGGIANNTNEFREFADLLAQISEDKGVVFDLTDNKKLKGTRFEVKGATVNAFVTDDGYIAINNDSKKKLNSLVGHEITHVLEGTEFYEHLQKAVQEYATKKGEWDTRLANITELYKKHKPDADPVKELTADLVGDYVFDDYDFVYNLATKHPTGFKAIWEEIKYLAKVATTGSKEARALEKAKHAFAKAWRETGNIQKNTVQKNGAQYDITALEDGRVYVTASRKVINGTTKAEQRKEISNFFSELLQDNPSIDIHTIEGDVLTISKAETAHKARDDYKTVDGKPVQMTDEEFSVKLNVEAHIDEVAEVSKKIGNSPDGKNHGFAKDGFTYRRAYFEDFDGQYYEVTLSIGHDGTVATVYNVGKIKESVPPSAKVIAVVGSQPLGGTHSKNSISQNSEKSSGSVKNSLSEEQETYFKDSVVRDENGNLKVMYHGTSDGGFTVFDTYGSKYGLFGQGSYFTDNKDIGQSYTNKGRGANPQVYEAYLNITNPIDMDAQADPAAWQNAFPDASFPESGTNEDFYRAMEDYFEDEGYYKYEASEMAVEALEGMGYDGITHVGGGRRNGNDSTSHQVYVAFHPEQIKDIDNVKPTGDADIRYSISEDSDGNSLSDGQKEFFKDTKAVDRNGNLLRVYHTTQNDFTVFDDSKKGTTTEGYNTYLGHFFTDNPDYMSEFPEFEGGKTEAYYLNMKNPIDMNNISRAAFLDIVEVTGGDVTEAAEIYDAEYKAEEERAKIRGGSPAAELPRLLEELTAEFYDDAEFHNVLRPNYDKLIAKGYDGIINNMDGAGWANEYVVLDSNQAKLTTNTNPTSDPDVRFSLSEIDNEYQEAVKNGNTNAADLAVERAADFAMPDSKIRGKDGKLIPLYHGTKEMFYEFDTSVKGGVNGTAEGFGIYLSDDTEVTGAYGDRQIKLYANITKPATSFDKTITSRTLTKLIKDTCEKEAKKMVADGEYDSVEDAIRDTWISNYVYTYDMSMEQAYREVATTFLQQNSSDMDVIQEVMFGLAIRDHARATEFYRNHLVPITGFDGFITKWENSSTGKTSNIYLAFDSSQLKSADPVTYDDNGNVIPLTDRFDTKKKDFRFSLSDAGETPQRGGGYSVYGDNIRVKDPSELGFAPFAEEVAPIRENVAPVRESTETVQESTETVQDMFPDDYAPLAEEETAARQSELLDSITDEDAPPEMDAPYYGEEEASTPADPFENRDIKDVGNRKVKAYMYENPEVKPFFQEEAAIMLGELERTTKGEKWFNDDLYYETNGEEGWGGTSRNTSDDIAYLLDELGYSYAEIRKGLNAIIEDDGAENNAISKRIEFLLNDRLSKGYTDFEMGVEIPPNQGYINLLTEKQISEYNDEARQRFFENADQYAPPADDDIGPVLATAPKAEYEAIRPRRQTAAEAIDDDIAPVGENVEYGDKLVRTDTERPGEKRRKWVGTSTESDPVKGKVLPDDLNQDTIHYQPISNKTTLGNANARLDKMGFESSVSYFNSQFAGKKVTLDDIALGERLIQEAVKRGDTKTAGELIQNVAILGTELGQKVQALSIIKRLTPEGQLGMLQKVVERGKTKGDKAYDDVEITQEMIDKILAVYGKDGTFDQKKLNEAVEKVKKDIADQMKVTKMDKVNAWRYLSMLGNPKTHIRNLVSNVAMKGTVAVKNVVARTMESVAPIKNRTKTWKAASDDVKAFAKTTTAEMKEVLSDGGKYSEDASIKEKRQIFKNKILNGLYEFNSDLLTKEDWWFSRPAFKNALSEYLTANGIRTAEDIKNNPKLVEKAKLYATEQSQIATFRQYSWLANKINDIERHNTATDIAVGAVLPFKKTPINIAKTGLNYSPLGFAKTLTYDASQVKNGKMEASEMIDHLAQNVTGSALTLVGYLLASAGFISGGGDDDKEGEYDYQLGRQSYAVNIGGKSFSLSWLSPVSMPLFVGANAYEQLVEGKEWNGDVVVETLAQTLDPLSEMSFLSGLNQVLSSYDSGLQKFAGIGESMIQNYATQFVPTLSSQVATVMDDTKRSTKVAADSDFKFFDETVNKLKLKIPFLRETLEPTTDIWGNEVKQTENILTRAFETFLAPYSKKDNIATEIDAEIKSLYSETGDNGIIPSIPYNYVNYDNVKYEMSASEYTAYKKTYGQTAYNLLEQLFATTTYQNASSEERAELVNKVYDYARDTAKAGLLSGRGVTFTNATKDGVDYYKENAIKGAIENDMSVDEYSYSRENPEMYEFLKGINVSYGEYKAADDFTKDAYTWAYKNPEKYTLSKAVASDVVTYRTYTSELYDIKADKDEDGKSISGSRKEKVIDYINNLDADYGEKIILFKSEYPSDDTYNYDIIDYLNSREDISYGEMNTILLELGFKIASDGITITWD